MAGLLYYKQSKVWGLIPSLAEERNKFKKEGWNVKVKTSVEILTHSESEQNLNTDVVIDLDVNSEG